MAAGSQVEEPALDEEQRKEADDKGYDAQDAADDEPADDFFFGGPGLDDAAPAHAGECACALAMVVVVVRVLDE